MLFGGFKIIFWRFTVMKKKVLSIVLALFMLLGLVPMFATPALAAEDLFNIKNGVLVRYGDEFGSPGPENVVIPNSVTEIGDSAFYDHNEIKSVSIPNSVVKIDDNAFWGCSSLNSITIPVSVKSIGKNSLGWDRTGSFHTAHDGFIIYGTTGSAAEQYAANATTTDGNRFIKFVSVSTAKPTTTPHPYATALRDYFNDATGYTAAYLADINGDGLQEMIAHKDTPNGGAECYRLFYFYNGKLCTYDKSYSQGSLFVSPNNYLVDYSYDMTKAYHILTIGNGNVIESTCFSAYFGDDPQNPTYYQNKNKISKSAYDALCTKYGVSGKNLFIPNSDHINRADQTTQILAMTNSVKVTGVTLNKTTLTIGKGKTYALKASIAPTNATTKAVTWTSSNTKVATVDKNGNVKAIGKGTATITATATDGSKVKKTCVVTIK